MRWGDSVQSPYMSVRKAWPLTQNRPPMSPTNFQDVLHVRVVFLSPCDTSCSLLQLSSYYGLVSNSEYIFFLLANVSDNDFKTCFILAHILWCTKVNFKTKLFSKSCLKIKEAQVLKVPENIFSKKSYPLLLISLNPPHATGYGHTLR